jgi:hypothetical protein
MQKKNILLKIAKKNILLVGAVLVGQSRNTYPKIIYG